MMQGATTMDKRYEKGILDNPVISKEELRALRIIYKVLSKLDKKIQKKILLWLMEVLEE